MAIRERKGRKKPWEVYWNNPFTFKRESLYVESEEEAKKQDALKKYQLKYEREIFLWEESQERKIEHTFESAYYLFLKDRRFSEIALKRHLKNMKPSLLLLKDTPLAEIDSAKLKIVIEHLRSRGIKASTIKRHMGQVSSLLHWRIKTIYFKRHQRFLSFTMLSMSTLFLRHLTNLPRYTLMHPNIFVELLFWDRKWEYVSAHPKC